MHAARFFVDRHATFSNQLHGLRIQHVLDLVNLRLERLERVVFRNLDRTLRDDEGPCRNLSLAKCTVTPSPSHPPQRHRE